MRRVIVLRPEPGASASVERARKLGLEAAAIPLFEIEPLDWEAPEAASFDGLLLTSANAVRSAGVKLERLRGLLVYAVGAATAEAAREAGFEVAAAGDAGVDRLLGSIEGELKLLHLAGEHRKEASPKQSITTIPVYRSSQKQGTDVAIAAGGVVLVHSLRAGRRFAELALENGLKRASIALAAISPAAADAVGTGWERVEAADSPTDEALLALAARLCNNPAPE